MTAVVARLKFSEIKLTIHGTQIRTTKWLNSKKKALNRPKKHLKRLRESIDDASKGLLVKQKTITVLLDTGLSGDLLFIKKGSQKYIPTMKRAIAQSWGTSNGTFQTKKVGVIDTELKHLCTT